MVKIKHTLAVLLAALLPGSSALCFDIQNPVPEQLQRLGERISYPQALCAVKGEDEARDNCLPGEILWYAPAASQRASADSTLAVVAKYCDLRHQVFHNQAAVVCIYQRNPVIVQRETGERVAEPQVPTLNQQYNAEIAKILNEDPNVMTLQDNVWTQVVNEGRLSGEPFRKGEVLMVELHLLSPRFEDDGSGHYYKQYTYEEAENSFLLSSLNQYWNSVDADVLVYSDLSWLPEELRSNELFGSQTLRAYHVIFKGLADREESTPQHKGAQ